MSRTDVARDEVRRTDVAQDEVSRDGERRDEVARDEVSRDEVRWDDERARAHARQLEGLLARLDPQGTAAVRALVELYGEAFARIMKITKAAGAVPALTGDELISHLLLLHGLHPEPVEARVRRALGGIEPVLAAHRATAELAGIDGETVRLVVGTAGRATTARTVTTTVEQAVRAAAPEIERVEIRPPAREPVLIPLEALRTRP